MKQGVYKIINKLNNKFYIGSTQDFLERSNEHFKALRKNKHHCIHLQRSYNIYGEENFEFIIFEECEEYLQREQELLDTLDFDNLYNVSKSATGGNLIHNHPNKEALIANATKRLMLIQEEWKNGTRKRPDINGPNNPNWKGGVTFCKCGNRISGLSKTCGKCRNRNGVNNPFYNKKHSEEYKKKASDRQSGIYNGNQNIKFYIDDILYNSLGEASKILDIHTTTISYRLKSKNLKFKNYYYAEEHA